MEGSMDCMDESMDWRAAWSGLHGWTGWMVRWIGRVDGRMNGLMDWLDG